MKICHLDSKYVIYLMYMFKCMDVIFSSGKEYISEENVQKQIIALKLMLGFLPHML